MEWSATLAAATAGLLIGLVFGATAQRTGFCTMGAVSDAVLFGDTRRLRAWSLAAAVALLASQALQTVGVIDLRSSIYLATAAAWPALLLGGGLFGFGMVLAGGCASRTLVRLGAGSLKALVVALVLAVSAGMALRGLLAPPRLALQAIGRLDVTAAGAGPSLPDLLAVPLGSAEASPILHLVVAVTLGGGAIAWCCRNAAFRRSPRHLLSGLIIGLLIPAGWLATGVIGADDFTPVPLASLTFVAPTSDALLYLTAFTGTAITFGVAVAGGVVAGAGAMAIVRREFRLEAFADTADMLRHIAGAAMMGVGGVTALGCTIGQGLSGISTLAVGSLLAAVGILAGAWWCLRWQEEDSLLRPLVALLPLGGRRQTR